jgi:hypothetical protein
MVVFAASVVGLFVGDVEAMRWTLAVLVPLALLTVVGHFVAIVSSNRLRA